MSKPTNCDVTFSMNSSIFEWSEISNFKILIFGNSFLRASNFSVFVPVARTFPSNDTNFCTNAFPIPPVAPVTNIFLFLKLIIQVNLFYIIFCIN